MIFFDIERERFVLWTPVLVGIGISVYFSLPYEPPLWIGGAAFLMCACCLVLGRFFTFKPMFRFVYWLALWMFFFSALGFLAAQLRTLSVHAPVWQEGSGLRDVEGVIVDIEPVGKRIRVSLEDVSISETSHPLPKRIRVTAAPDPTLRPGQRIRMRASLMPPPAPNVPYGYDFARQAWFSSLGAVGYTRQKIEHVASSDPSSASSFAVWMATLRGKIRQQTAAVIKDPAAAAIAATLITGGTGNVPPDTLNHYRDSGLAHLLSISGLHMGLVAGVCFIFIRRGLAFFPSIALRYPIRKWAAFLCVPMAFFYLLLAGAPVPTIRSFVMISVVLAAILVDRTVLSLRTVCLAALVVLLWQPETLLGPSFQMSFAAVTALIAFYESNHWSRGRGRAKSFLGKIVRYGVGIIITTLIASWATSVYGVFHFNRFSSYGVIANLIAIPVTGFWVMPWAVIGLFLLPFGGQDFAFMMMGWGIEVINETAAVVAAWPGAVLVTPSLSLVSLGLFTLGGVWWSFWSGRWCFWGIPLMIVALCSLFFARPPSFLISGDGRVMAARNSDGDLMIHPHHTRLTTLKQSWLDQNGTDRALIWPRSNGYRGDKISLLCDGQGCRYTVQGQTLSLVFDRQIIRDECATAAVVISTVSLPAWQKKACQSYVVDRFALQDNGTHVFWPEQGKVLSVRQWQGDRPWALQRRRPQIPP